jgi:flagellar hook-basal body complex protein FliE
MNPINPLSIPTTTPGSALGAPDAAGASPSFKDFLLSSIQEVNSMQQAADQAVETLITGEDINPAEVLTAVQKADIAFRMMMQIRNKIVQAYQEVQSIRV